jgi:hypothetical protein
MKNILLLSVFGLSFTFAQAQPLVENFKSEIGIDGYFSIGNQGGNFSAGLKFGALKKEEDSKVVIGPSVRWMRVWSKNFATAFQPASYNIFGLGAFAHWRVVDGIYLGAEFESLKSPLNYVIITEQKKWVPTLFLGGGYSKAFDDRFRLNVGIFYDIINDAGSPYRPSYLTRKTGPNGEPGALIPILYRLQLVIPLY